MIDAREAADMGKRNWQKWAGIVLLVFVTAAIASAQKFKVLYAFTDGADGAPPSGDLLLQGSELYGISGGGTGGGGVLFQVDINSGLETTLFSFSKTGVNGPAPGLALDSAGNFYGTAVGGGSSHSGVGVVFEVTSAGVLSVLHNFSGGKEGGTYPRSGLMPDSAGNLYGVAQKNTDGGGVVFKIDPAGNFTTLYVFGPKADCRSVRTAPSMVSPLKAARAMAARFFRCRSRLGSEVPASALKRARVSCLRLAAMWGQARGL
jgi:uncharacterized repeat protein (TIGR03803 family)